MEEEIHQPLALDHVGLRVRSLFASSAYYGALLPLLGFAQVSDRRWSQSGGLFVDLQQADADTSDYDRMAPGLNHLAFRAPDPSLLEQIQRAMRNAGFEAPEIQTFPGAVALFMRDPDGIRFEVSFEDPSAS